MTTLSWLHLSDWHQKGQDFGRQVVRDALLRDIRERERIDPRLASIDFIVFSGDLAFGAQPVEYEAAREQLLEPVRQATGLEASRIFCVPGNHDLDRDTVYEMLPKDMLRPLDSDALVQKWLTEPKRRKRVLEPFEAYNNFISEYTGQPTPDYASTLQLDIAGKRVALLGINSAWMCARNKDADDEVNDYGFTLVGEPQIHDALAQIAAADVKVAVMHHPFEWLTEFDRDHVEDRLMREVHFILRGHEHKPKVSAVCGTAGDCVVIPAGASYKRRTAEDPRYTNAYNFVLLDLETEEGTVFLRRWSDPRNEWVDDTDTHPGGKFSIKPLPKNLSGAGPTGRGMKATAAPAATCNFQVAEQRYRELLLETCDIINLANLPEQDRHITQKQPNLNLRGLYIPLRVQVEVSAGDDRVEGEYQEKVWEALERRRNLAHRGNLPKLLKNSEHQRVPVGDRLALAKRLVVLGDPGAGKTTLTRWIATAYLLRLKQSPQWVDLPDVKTLPDADWLPIIVRCRDLDADALTGSLDDILKHTLRKAELKQEEVAELRTLLQARIEAGQALLMLDGLDEITDPAVRAGFCQQLEQIVVAYPHMPIIATSRIVGYREMGYKLSRGFEHLTLADLTPEEKDDFARRWCSLTEIPERRADAAKELIHDIHSADRIERLTGNPMLLTTMALVKRKIGKLPNRRAELYWEAVQVLLNWRSDVGAQLDVREALPQLEYLAYYMCDRGVQHLRKDEILELFGRMRSEYPYVHAAHNRTPDDFLKCLESRTGILIEAGQMRHLGMLMPVYEFRHLTFQEYLAARALVDGRLPNRDSKKSLAANVAPLAGRTTDAAFTENGPQEAAVVENWREALRLCAAICNDDDIDSLLRAVLTPQEGESEAVHRARAILATLCVADEPNVSEVVVREIFSDLIKHITIDDGGGRVKTGVDVAIREIAGTRWSALLRAILLDDFLHHHPNDPVKREVIGDLYGLIVALEAPQDKKERAAWLSMQAQDLARAQSTQVAEIALGIMQLGFEHRLVSVPGLEEALLRHINNQPPVQHAVAAALSWLTNSGWRPTDSIAGQLLDLIQDGQTDSGATLHLVLLFGNIRAQRAVEPIISHLKGSNATVRWAAAHALGQLNNEAAVGALISRLDDPDTKVRMTAATSLSHFKSEAAVGPLISRLDDPDTGVRGAAVKALFNSNNETAIAPLVAILDDPNVELRQDAAAALGQISSEAAVGHLISHLEDTDAQVRGAIAEALGKAHSEAAVGPLISHLDDPDEYARSCVAQALGRINNEAGVAALISRLGSSDASMRLELVAALGKAHSEAAVGPLISHLDDPSASVREEAAMALGHSESEAAAGPLISHLDDPNASVRRAVAYALGRIKSERAALPLISRLDDPEISVRLAAATALGQINTEGAVAALVSRLDDPNADTRRAAMGGLAHTTDYVERQLLSRDLDGLAPFLDPEEVISETFAQKAASQLAITLEEVKARYEALAGRSHLKLEWRLGGRAE